MSSADSLLDELRVRYEAVRESTDEHGDVESFPATDARLREAFRWLEKAITYLNGLKPPIEHRFDLGHGYVFDSPRFAHGPVGQHERRIRVSRCSKRSTSTTRFPQPSPCRSRWSPGGSRLSRRHSMRSGCNTPAVAWKIPTGR